MAWIKDKSPGDLRWYIVFAQYTDGSREIFPALADPDAPGAWRTREYDQDYWADRSGVVTHYHKIEPWPDPPAQGE
jgi:hypothetical protein